MIEREADDRFAATFRRSAVPMGIARLHGGELIDVNDRFLAIMGFQREEVVGKTTEQLGTYSRPGQRDKFIRTLREQLVVQDFPLTLRHKDGTQVKVRMSASIVVLSGDQCVLATFQDVTELESAREQLAYQALHDSLTGLPNRPLFWDRLQQTIVHASRRDVSAAILFIDLDAFKEINDTFGHAVGDRLLQDVARRLVASVRASDTIARLGGDEFAAILKDVSSEDDAGALALKLLNSVRQPFWIDDRLVEIGASIGVALCPQHGTTVESLLQNADAAMYQAKQQHLGVNVYRPGQTERVSANFELRRELGRALDQGQLALHYQPKIDLSSGKLIGFEALLRWPHPARGLLLPGSFIPLAERDGTIQRLSTWVLESAVSQLRSWEAEGLCQQVAVNLSIRDFDRPSLAAEVQALCEKWQVPPRSLRVEITESLIMANPTRVMDVVTQMHDLGIEFSIDDFGTGYSSLAYLKHFPVAEIKIDKSLIGGIVTDASDDTIVRSVIDLAHNLGRVTVAEGVESEEVLQRLKALGCDAAQGYFFAAPMPASEVTGWVRGNTGPDHSVRGSACA